MANQITHDEQDLPMSADAVDVALEGTCLDLEPSGPGLALHSLDPNGIAQNRTEIVIVNMGTDAVTLKHNSATGTAGMRLWFRDAVDHTLAYRQQLWGQRIDGDDGQFWLMELPG